MKIDANSKNKWCRFTQFLYEKSRIEIRFRFAKKRCRNEQKLAMNIFDSKLHNKRCKFRDKNKSSYLMQKWKNLMQIRIIAIVNITREKVKPVSNLRWMRNSGRLVIFLQICKSRINKILWQRRFLFSRQRVEFYHFLIS